MMQHAQKSLYVPSMEHDACGIGFTAHMKGQKSHSIIDDALTMLENMEHRGATGSEANTGDGAGILIQNPHEFFARICNKLGFDLPEFGKYGLGMIFFPKDDNAREECREKLNEIINKFGFELLGYRKVPVNRKGIGQTALSVEPEIEQVFVKPQHYEEDMAALERRLFVLRNYSERMLKKIPGGDEFYFVSLSYKTIIYKGQLRSFQVRSYFPDLEDKTIKSAVALVHSRFSTNTFPKWKLAQPFRYIAHNGEINTVRGNINWNKSYETLFHTSKFTKEEIELLLPLLDETDSDSSNLDRMVEMLLLSGRPLEHVMMMLIPEAWEHDELMEPHKKAFYEYYSGIMQPWDGPASVCFTNGKTVGACLDRNGLRPSRYWVTEDDQLIMGSETGILPRIAAEKVVKKGLLEPGKIFILNMEEGRIISDKEIKDDICNRKPYREWLDNNKVSIDDLPQVDDTCYPEDPETLLQRQKAYGYTSEDVKTILAPMFGEGKEPLGSMGSDTPLACLSNQSQHLANYFKQLFAQVSNPPMDPIRERNVMSLHTSVGKALDILDEKPEHCQIVAFDQPIISNEELEKIRQIHHPNFRCHQVDATFPTTGSEGELEAAVDRICKDAEDAIRFGNFNILLISDRNVSQERAPIPTLMATGAIHHHLIRTNMRARVGLVIESGDAREVHHFATIIGFGGNVVNPYLALESFNDVKERKLVGNEISREKATKNYIKAVGGGLLKIFAKMGISTLHSYHGAQIFEALGLSTQVVNKCFAGTLTRIQGMDFDALAKEVLVRHRIAFPKDQNVPEELEVGGVYQWKHRGEFHQINPATVALLQEATRKNDYETYRKYADTVNDFTENIATIRGLFKFKSRRSILIEEVEPIEKITPRFATGAMSFGSISYEAHSTLAIAMNAIGAKSNSGEGGEDPVRFDKKPDGTWERSAIKQVASGRFGVNAHYLTNADEIQIKIAQGAKPGEGGHLPGAKVDDWIGRVRNSTPGVALISPPPHHDIYSIEDLKQLIFDLKNANRAARINVKLVSNAGVGTIAAGVAKAKADAILISGGDGGTGASPLSSIKHAGLPFELGLAESHQTLVRNNLRSRVTLQTDGQLKTGRDIAVAALLGAEEWGVSTAALITAGCIMMRKCHSNTCPVGVATQRKELRERYTGKAEHVINMFRFLAQDLREIMAQLGFRTVNEMIGQVDALEVRDDIKQWKAKYLDLKVVLGKEFAGPEVGLYQQIEQDHELDEILDWKLLEAAKPVLEKGANVTAEFPIINTDRTVGAMLSNEITKVYGGDGLPGGTVHFKFTGSAGQSFGAFSVLGTHFELEGDANDYVGKGLSGGGIIIYPPKVAKFVPEENTLIGNVALYGATRGEVFIRGMAGQRFAVRNSGARAVVEGVSDHGCEYMTGGVVIVLGKTGRNFAAGMSGGVAYVLDVDKKFDERCNKELVDFDPIEAEDKKMMLYLLEKHVKFTDSVVAKKILNDFENQLQHFVKVMPRDYKIALNKKKEQEAQGALV